MQDIALHFPNLYFESSCNRFQKSFHLKKLTNLKVLITLKDGNFQTNFKC